ncbi:AraC-like DNA-binding protein [Anaerobacterium chartisolvens]|uniref:AraC-like DNA-binding protein n=1 Tax=Anaerobacterium chartisolvens TaxID=1297424 RepID=A0A369BBX1_9FIRM|nr:AraC family transcriptional regulator [Anaerobacterium chartisolvens]RCX18845.1 AraC-like DNA-binding protein [Anaerobacterium chartisolvens]
MEYTAYISKAEDFFNIFTEKYNFMGESTGIQHKYRVAEEYGSGCMDRYSLKNGLEICMINLCLKKAIQFQFKTSLPVFEVVYCTQGRVLRNEQGMGELLLNEGNMVIYVRGKYEGFIEIPANMNIKCISIAAYNPFSGIFRYDPDGCDEGYGRADIKSLDDLMRPHPICPWLKAPFSEMQGCTFSGIAKLMYLECKAMEIISFALEKKIISREKTEIAVMLRKTDIEKINLARQIIHENITDPLSVDELSERVKLNSCKLKSGFKHLYGNTIFGYLKDIRLEKARELLDAGHDMNINEIVNEVGYSNTGHFARAFREKYGVNPKDYRLRT